jgi:hypothetical protein
MIDEGVTKRVNASKVMLTFYFFDGEINFNFTAALAAP